MIRYFSDNLFSAAITEIYNENKETTGYLDLKNVFTSTLSVMDAEQQELVKGKMGFFAHWTVSDANDNKLGMLKQKFTLFSKKYHYFKPNGEIKYSIESEALSKEYDILDDKGTLAAKFERVSHFFSSPAYKLHVINDGCLEEMIAIVMGVGKMQNQNAAAASSSTT
ncbi:hypothetical protein ABES38_03065 [Bacillus gobiensis]|uniref:hypothetical protein n=1 Tax=Bacillus gobiensis TaxID=1441095 RepID=UPI003D1B688A